MEFVPTFTKFTCDIMSEAANTTILTPDVYLNHLAPYEVHQFEISRNVYIAVLGVG